MTELRVMQVGDLPDENNDLAQLAEQGFLRLVFRETDVRQAQKLVVEGLPFDVVVMNAANSAETRGVVQGSSGRVVMLCNPGATNHLKIAEDVGALGTLVRPVGPTDLLTALRRAARSEQFTMNPLADLGSGDSATSSIDSGVLEHIDAVREAVAALSTDEPDPVAAVFYDTLLDQLDILRDHVEGRGPVDVSSVKRFLNFARTRLADTVEYVPKMYGLLSALDDVLSALA